MARTGPSAPRLGLLGELEVELKLVEAGWHSIRLDTASMASNADLLAVNQQHRVLIQVKTTNGNKQGARSRSLGFGYAGRYLKDGESIFNSKQSPLIADVIVAVNYHAQGSRFVIMPVSFAEKLCRHHCDYWYDVPKKKGSGRRSPSFMISLCFEGGRRQHQLHHESIRRNLQVFVDRWDVLAEPIDKLHDSRYWPLEL